MKGKNLTKRWTSVYITHADKGNITVALNGYESKIREHLKDGRWEATEENNANAVVNKTKDQISTFLSGLNNTLAKSLWFALNSKTNRPRRFYTLTKTHNPELSNRSVVDYIPRANYTLANTSLHQ